MNNKKGFTLVELLAVIVVLGLIIAIAVPSINAISIKIKENMLDTKIKDIEKAAEIYADDMESGSPVTVEDLVKEGYYKKESNDCTLGSNDKPCVTSPVDGTSLDLNTITINFKDGRYKATFNK